VEETFKKHNLCYSYGEVFEVMGDTGSKERAKTSFGDFIGLCCSYYEADKAMEGILLLRYLLVKNGAWKEKS
jgi:hypothetical protein